MGSGMKTLGSGMETLDSQIANLPTHHSLESLLCSDSEADLDLP